MWRGFIGDLDDGPKLILPFSGPTHPCLPVNTGRATDSISVFGITVWPICFLAALESTWYRPVEIDIFRSWKLVSAKDFRTIQSVHWRKLPYWIFTPLRFARINRFNLVPPGCLAEL